MPAIWHHLWRWLRFPFAIAAALLVGLLVWAAWLLSGQRYQLMLTQQLSALLGAEVRVVSSRLSFLGGLGIQLDTVTVQDSADAAPLFTADRIDLLLDLSALLHGQLLFHRVDCVKARMQLAEEGRTLLRLLDHIQAAQGKTETTDQWLDDWLSPTLALQRLELHDGEIVYPRQPQVSPLALTHTDAALAYTPGEGMRVSLAAALGQGGDIGQVTLRASTPRWDGFAALSQAEWQGEVGLRGVLIQALGRALGNEWPPMTLDLSGRYQGKWVGPAEFAGEVKVGGARAGGVRVREGKARLTKVVWSGQTGTPFSLPSLLRALVVEAQIEEIRGEVGEEDLPVRLHKGTLMLRDEELTATGIAGFYGARSHITEITGTLKRLFASHGPALAVRLVADVPGLAALSLTTTDLHGLPVIGLRESPHFGLNVVVKRAMDIA
ncbi:MAG: hypothetical protein HYZ72_08485, partial [Deltaproteobacteria bacterium]|nr:hypothetical protein [Deltaproteobacteria bacterium]